MYNQFTPTNTQQPQQQQQCHSPQIRPPSASVVVSTSGGAATITTTTTSAVDTSSNAYDIAFEDGVAREQITKREIFDFDKYDIASNPFIPCMLEAKPPTDSQKDVAVTVMLLFNSITTIMVLLTNFKRNADPEVVQEFGSDWDTLTNLMIYAPLGFFLMLILAINNYFSERVFYEYLNRGILVDFPQTGEFSYIFKSCKPLVFVVLFVAYTALCVGVMLKGRATVGIIISFCLNMGVGIGKMWYFQQSIESRFVSLSDFIMCFPQRDKVTASKEQREKERVSAVMDESNLKHAAYYMKRVVLNSTASPCWSDAMRLHRWHSQNSSGAQILCFHVSVWMFILVLIGSCVGYFTYQGQQDIVATWSYVVNPCVQTCANVTKAVGGNSLFSNVTCDACLCSCMHGYHKIHDAYTSKCVDHFQMPTQCVSVTTVGQMCAGLSQCATKFTGLS